MRFSLSEPSRRLVLFGVRDNPPDVPWSGPEVKYGAVQRKNILGTLVAICTYDTVVERVLAAAREKAPLTVAAQPVHGIMTAWLDPSYGGILNAVDIVTPDGQPVRWALNGLHGAGLTDRVYGPTLMLRVCAAAAREGRSIFLYGSTAPVLERLTAALTARFPGLAVAGTLSPPFGEPNPVDEAQHVEQILASRAAIVFVGLGCPRQERWMHRHAAALQAPVLALGAAFDFHAGTKAQAPAWMQARGLEWLFRLISEPRRLAGRYILLNPMYVVLILLQRLGRSFPEYPAAPTRAAGIRH
jgi:N-acetylglucosaminyldiphosphoundecaprenol N-acetyl-beta-D-mannosaminyltransferase